MPFNDKVLLLPNGCELIRGETEIDIDNAMALRAGEVVVMLASSTNAVVMRPIRKLDAGKQPPVHQLFDRTVDRRSTDPWLGLA